MFIHVQTCFLSDVIT